MNEEVQLACFKVAGETYGAEIFDIKEIIMYREATAVPKAPDFMEGIINLRGKVIPVIDMRKRLGIKPLSEAKSRSMRIIIVKIGQKDVGIVVDSVDKVIKARRGKDGNIDPSPEVATGIGPEYLKGVARDGDDMVMILDMEKVLSSKEKVRLGDLEDIMDEKAKEEE